MVGELECVTPSVGGSLGRPLPFCGCLMGMGAGDRFALWLGVLLHQKWPRDQIVFLNSEDSGSLKTVNYASIVFEV